MLIISLVDFQVIFLLLFSFLNKVKKNHVRIIRHKSKSTPLVIDYS